MFVRLVLVCLFSICTLFSFAQAQRLSGKILNERNEPLAGVSVKVVGTNVGTSTDVEGRFSLNLIPQQKYELEFSAIGYETKTISDVEVLPNQVNELNAVLTIKAKANEEVVVTARRSSARLETAASVISFQRNTNTVASVISAESIRRSPDRNTGEVLKRTPGASIQEGRFIIVRGLPDRYNQAMLNGILLTSTEPDRKTFSFDLIPAPMIDNIIINKAFVPEYPGEWAGGLIQVNTKDIPAKGFFNVQVGTGFNTATIGKDFYREKRGNLDWLGIDDGARALPKSYTTKYSFDILSAAEKTAIGKEMPNRWVAEKVSAPLNVNFQLNGGFTTGLFGKKLGGNFGLVYNKTNNNFKNVNRFNTYSGSVASTVFDYDDDLYRQEILAGALGSLSLQLNPANKITLKSIINVNTTNSVIQRSGINNDRNEFVKGSEFTFRENTFFTTQLSGEHTIAQPLKLKWYGAFNILDGYVPDQRRVLYTSPDKDGPYSLLLSGTLSQQSGSRLYQSLSDYIYTGGGDLTYNITKNHTVKGGYLLQIKDRLFDAQFFALYLPTDNSTIRNLSADQAFAAENFGDGTGNKLAFDAIKNRNFRYLANTILNAGYLQFDNQLTNKLRIVWGLRVENYDQLVGSVKKWDDRHTYSEVTDYLPGINATYKVTPKTNIRLSGSQTVIRPEFRELAALNIYDFELNASVQGNPSLKRSKVTNFDLRYELYPRAAETFSVGVFYKYFQNPIEQLFNAAAGGASSFNFQNSEKATSYGAEVELRKKLDFSETFRNFIFQGNVAYIHSRVENSKGFEVDRPMQGQSPYVLNFGLMYDLEKSGFTATLLYNQIGQRLAYVGNIDDGFPDIYEAGRPLLDLQLTQKVLNKKGEFRLNVSDMMNRVRYFYQSGDDKTSFQKEQDAPRFTRKFGTTFSLSFNYSL
jgi:outer membrane receptor protein involved in Fe transport